MTNVAIGELSFSMFSSNLMGIRHENESTDFVEFDSAKIIAISAEAESLIDLVEALIRE